MSNAIVVRDLKPEDVTRLLEITVAAWTPIYASYRQVLGDDLFGTAYPDWQESKRKQVRSACDPADPTQVLVAEQEGRVVGFATFRTDPSGVGELGNNAVDTAHRGKGIAQQMYRCAFDRLRESGMRFVKVSTGGDPCHAPARRAYEKAGFLSRLSSLQYFRQL